jgi:IS5 family transposase
MGVLRASSIRAQLTSSRIKIGKSLGCLRKIGDLSGNIAAMPAVPAPMRRIQPDQLVLVPAFHTHVHSREVRAMSRILDEHPEVAKWVHADLVGRKGRKVSAQRGREGMSGEQVLRVILVKQLGGFSYHELAFHLADSISYRAFCRFEVGRPIPSKKTLQRNVKKVDALTLERINVVLIEHAINDEIEDGNKIRIDCTVVETNIHEPTDSSLLVDSVRVLVRLMNEAQDYVDAPFNNHHRRAKRRAIGILHARCQEDRVPLYHDLLKVTNKTATAAERVIATFTAQYSPRGLENPLVVGLLDSLQHYVSPIFSSRTSISGHGRRAICPTSIARYRVR